MLRILVVDDHPLLRAALQCLLGAADGITVVGLAADGPQALTLAQDLRPDVVLMDVFMAGMDGIEATALLRSRVPAPAVVMLSSCGHPEQVSAAFDAGAAGYLLKDVPPDRLVAAVQGLERGEPPVDRRVARILQRRESRPDVPANTGIGTAAGELSGSTFPQGRSGTLR